MSFDVERYAKLARIKLTEEEIEKFQKDIGELLEHAQELKKIKADVEPMTGGTDLRNVFREDVAEPAKDFEPNFPESENGYLKVPKILDNE